MNKNNVLIVDDDKDMTALLKARLSAVGIDADVAHAAVEGIEKMKRELYCVVLADIHMPGMSGVEMVSALKQFNPLVQIIMLTSDVSLGRVIECVDRGAMDFFSKTEDLAALAEAASGALRRSARWIKHVGARQRKTQHAGLAQ